MPKRSTATPLALAFALLITYASLYPFAGWRGAGVPLWDLIVAPWPRYWTWFDVIANWLGYAPLGFLLAWTLGRSHRPLSGAFWAVILSSGLSLSLEWMQGFLPQRIPSNVDWLLNTAGAFIGAIAALLLGRLALIERIERWRQQHLVADSRTDLVLLALWPVAILYPASVPFGLGQVRERLSAWLPHFQGVDLFGQTYLAPFGEWLTAVPPPLSPYGELTTMALALLSPCLLAMAAMRTRVGRWAVVVLVMWVAATMGLVSGTLTYGPDRALEWWRPGMLEAMFYAALAALVGSTLPRGWLLVGLVLTVMATLYLLNVSAPTAYLDQSLLVWEQGRFIRFHGVSKWFGWLWPMLVLAHVITQLTRRR